MNSATLHPVDLYETVTERIVKSLEQGTAPWVRPWSQDVDTAPVNAASIRAMLNLEAFIQSSPFDLSDDALTIPS